MALTFEYCRSCGGRTQIDIAVPAGDRRCVLCGESCSRIDEIDKLEEEEGAGEPGESQAVQQEKGERGAGGGSPTELVMANCPRCRAKIAIDPDRPLKKQRCHACGMLLEEPPKKGRERKRSRFTADGVLPEQTRERVWMPVLGTMLSVVFVIIFGIWMASRRRAESIEAADSGPVDPRLQIRELIAKFTAAKTPEELLPLIRDPATFEKPLREWCAAHPTALPLGGELVHIRQPREALGTHLAEATVVFPGQPSTQFLTVETPAGYRVDWRAYIGIADMSVAEFLAQKPSAPTLLMAVVRRSDYYNNAYADSKAWQCLHVSNITGANGFFAYAPRSSDGLMKSIAALPRADSRLDLKPATVSRPMALRMHFTSPNSADSLQAEIESIAGEGWYVP